MTQSEAMDVIKEEQTIADQDTYHGHRDEDRYRHGIRPVQHRRKSSPQILQEMRSQRHWARSVWTESKAKNAPSQDKALTQSTR
eukprot:10375591-Heterocapsa_arctica.AAC.1